MPSGPRSSFRRSPAPRSSRACGRSTVVREWGRMPIPAVRGPGWSATPGGPMTQRRVPRWSELRPLLQGPPRTLDATARRLRPAAPVEDLREQARRRVPRAVFDYTDGGAGRELALRRSRAAFDRVELVPSTLRDVSSVDTSTTVFGARTAMPLVLAPTGFTRLMNHQGEPAVARAAARAGVPYTLSTMGTTSVEDLALQAPRRPRWVLLFLWRDREASKELVRRAAAAGYEALVLTVDTPVGGLRLRDVRNGMTIPPAITGRTVLDGARHPSWWVN